MAAILNVPEFNLVMILVLIFSLRASFYLHVFMAFVVLAFEAIDCIALVLMTVFIPQLGNDWGISYSLATITQGVVLDHLVSSLTVAFPSPGISILAPKKDSFPPSPSMCPIRCPLTGPPIYFP